MDAETITITLTHAERPEGNQDRYNQLIAIKLQIDTFCAGSLILVYVEKTHTCTAHLFWGSLVPLVSESDRLL